MANEPMTKDQGDQIIRLLRELTSTIDLALHSIRSDVNSTDSRINDIYYLVHHIDGNVSK